jgi:hypothetical protein
METSRVREIMNQQINDSISHIPDITTMFKNPELDLSSLGITTRVTLSSVPFGRVALITSSTPLLIVITEFPLIKNNRKQSILSSRGDTKLERP